MHLLTWCTHCHHVVCTHTHCTCHYMCMLCLHLLTYTLSSHCMYMYSLYMSLHVHVITHIDTTHCNHPGHQHITLDASVIILGRRLHHFHHINLSSWMCQLSPWVCQRLHHVHPGSFRLLWHVIPGYDFCRFKRFSYLTLDNSALDCVTEPNLHRLGAS